MDSEIAKMVLSAVAVLGGLGSAVVAIAGYRQRTAQEKARWLETMVRRFSEQVVPPVRIAVGQVGDPAMRAAVSKRLAGDIASLTADEVGLLESFDRYFTFFEFLQYLYERRVLRPVDIDTPFRYFLTSLEANDSTRDWLHTFYPGLRRLVGEAQQWTVTAELALFRQGHIDEPTLRTRLRERIGGHPEAIALTRHALARMAR